MTTKDSSMDLIVVTQAAMTDTLASLSKTLEKQSGTLVEIQVTLAENSKEVVHVLKEMSRFQGEISSLNGRMRNQENITNVNKFARQFAPRMFFSLVAAVGVGASVTYAVLEIAGKG